VGELLCPFSWGGAGSPSNTMSPGPRPTSVTSSILIHPTVWPQYTSVTKQTGRQTTTRYHRANHFTNGRPKIRDAPHQHNSMCPSTEGTCPRARPCWEWMREWVCGPGVSPSPGKFFWSFRCKFMLSCAFLAWKLTREKLQYITHFHFTLGCITCTQHA